MRDLFNKKQTRISPDSLRSNLIVSFQKQNDDSDDEIIEYDFNTDDHDDYIENDDTNIQ